MKLLSIAILRKDPHPPTTLAIETDLTSFGFFQRSSIQEFLEFFSVTLVERTASNLRQVIVKDNYYGYIYNHPQGLGGVMISEGQYPERVAFTLINKILEEFLIKYPRIHWMASSSTTTLPASSFGQEGKTGLIGSLYSGMTSVTSVSSTSSISKKGGTSVVPSTPFPSLKGYITKYQDPSEADTIMKVQKEIDETKVILHQTIENLLERGEKLDHLVDKSNNLSMASKQFFKMAKKTNACQCSIQ